MKSIQAKRRTETYRKSFEEIRSRLGTRQPGKYSDSADETRRAIESLIGRQKDWWGWELRARAEPDPMKKEKIYRKGIEQFKDSAELKGALAAHLAWRMKNSEEAKRLYLETLNEAPYNAHNTVSFAHFLKEFGNDKERAESESLCRHALELAPNDGVVLAHAATFLADSKPEEAEQLFRRAIPFPQNQPWIFGRFADFLSRRKPADAESFYRQAISSEPNNPDPRANLALFLLSQGRNREAEDQAVGALTANDQSVQAKAEALLYIGLSAKLENKDDSHALGRLRTLLKNDFVRIPWSFEDIFEVAAPKLTEDDTKLYSALGAAILDTNRVSDLETLPRWQHIKALPLDPLGFQMVCST